MSAHCKMAARQNGCTKVKWPLWCYLHQNKPSLHIGRASKQMLIIRWVGCFYLIGKANNSITTTTTTTTIERNRIQPSQSPILGYPWMNKIRREKVQEWKSFWEGWGATTNPPNIQENKQIATTSDSKSCLSYAFFFSLCFPEEFFHIFLIFLAKLQTTSFTKCQKENSNYCKSDS